MICDTRQYDFDLQEFKELWSDVDVILDGGACNELDDRRGSTIIDFTVPGKFSIVRVGWYVSGNCTVVTKYCNLATLLCSVIYKL